ncbi:hypothetical protein D9M72_646880 [compost metagenome]
MVLVDAVAGRIGYFALLRGEFHLARPVIAPAGAGAGAIAAIALLGMGGQARQFDPRGAAMAGGDEGHGKSSVLVRLTMARAC